MKLRNARILAGASLLVLGLVGSGVAVDLQSLPEIDAVVDARLPLPTDGVRGLLFEQDSVVLLATSNRGLSAPDSSFQASLMRWQASSTMDDGASMGRPRTTAGDWSSNKASSLRRWRSRR